MRLYQAYSRQFILRGDGSVQNDFIVMHDDLRKKNNLAYYHLAHCGYDFVTIFESSICGNSLLSSLKKVDVCVAVSLTPEFDPRFTHVSAYLQDRYGLCCDFLDLSEHTLSPVFVALAMAKKYLNSPQVNRIAVLIFQQQGIYTDDPDFSCDQFSNQVDILCWES